MFMATGIADNAILLGKRFLPLRDNLLPAAFVLVEGRTHVENRTRASEASGLSAGPARRATDLAIGQPRRVRRDPPSR
jgi:hypothetical protein